MTDLLTGLPGESLVRTGLAEHAARSASAAAYLVDIARLRLVRSGLLPATDQPLTAEPERALYRLLLAQGGDAYSRYNALLRELASFESALDHRLRAHSLD